MKSTRVDQVVFYHSTTREAAERILEEGFPAGAQANGVRLFDQRPDPAAGEVVLRVALPPDAAAELLKRGHAGAINGRKQFVAPVDLLRTAYVSAIGGR